MLIVSKVALILSLCMYIIPIFIYWEKMDGAYKISRGKVLLIKLAVVASLIFVFMFTYQSKVLFYPWKCTLVIGILLIAEYIDCVCISRCNTRLKLVNKLTSIMFIVFTIFVIMAVGSFFSINAPQVYNEDYVTTAEYEIENVYSEEVEYVSDEGNIDKISINDSNVYIKFVKDLDEVRIEEIVKYRRYYQNPYAKDLKIITDENPYVRRYNIYIYNES